MATRNQSAPDINTAGVPPATPEAHQRAVESDEIFGAAVYSYSRAQAIEDGVLIDAGQMAREAGFRVPVAITQAAWSDCVAWGANDSTAQTWQDEEGRLWDVLFMARLAARRAKSRVEFELHRVPRDGYSMQAEPTPLQMVIGPGDSGEPVITILLANED